MSKPANEIRLIAENRRARFDYIIEDVFEAGIVLTGTEVKSLRAGRATIAESYARPEGPGMMLINANIAEYPPAAQFNHAPKRPRQLLLHRKQINRLKGAVEREGRTIIPLRIFFNARGIAKIEIGLAHGKKAPDKRASEKEKDLKRDQARLMRDRG